MGNVLYVFVLFDIIPLLTVLYNFSFYIFFFHFNSENHNGKCVIMICKLLDLQYKGNKQIIAV